MSEEVSTKRKKQQISIGDYFSKRRKMSTSSTAKGIETSEKIVNGRAPSLLESEAEKRLSIAQCERSPATYPAICTKTKLPQLHTLNIPDKFAQMPSCCETLSNLVPSPKHTIMFRPHLLGGMLPKPYPDRYRDYWDKSHVRMPCSSENRYPTHDKKIQKRWELIEGTLLQPFQTSKDLEEAILVYNHHYKDKWNFEAWHSYCNIHLDDDEREELFGTLLPNMVDLALRLPNIVTQSPKLLQKGSDHSLTFSQEQVACLLANAFFCTYPRRNSLKTSDSFGYPDINFSRVFRGVKDVVNGVKTEKLKTILNYFRRVVNDMPTGSITYTRKVLECSHKWDEVRKSFSDLFVSSQGTIEDDAEGMTHVDFANRMVGGGVVGEGCVQEEIRFLICPELIISRLFTEKLEPNESLLITGAERFSNYSGYAQTFKYEGSFHDLTPRDRWGRRYTQILAIDAHVFHCYADQFKTSSLKRELDKALCGFFEPSASKPAIATGNWGCGAFGGDVHLKALLQLMAATEADRDVVYFTFGDEKFGEQLREMHEFLQTNSVTVGQLWCLLLQYSRSMKSQKDHIQLYPYLRSKLSSSEVIDNETNSSTDGDTLEMRGVPCEIPEDMEQLSPDYAADTP